MKCLWMRIIGGNSHIGLVYGRPMEKKDKKSKLGCLLGKIKGIRK